MFQRGIRALAGNLTLLQSVRQCPQSFPAAVTMPSPSARSKASVTSVHTDKAYKPFAHYLKSQAIKSPGHVWLSGQIPADASGNFIEGSMTEQAQAIIRNTEAILLEAGSSLENVVKVVVYVKDAKAMPEFAAVYDPAFPHKPARSMVEVSNLPAGVDIQVDFIAVTTSPGL